MVDIVINKTATTKEVLDTESSLVVTKSGSMIDTAAFGTNMTLASGFNSNVAVAVYGQLIAKSSAIAFRLNTTVNIDNGFEPGGNHDIFIGKTGTVTSLESTAIQLAGPDNNLVSFGEIFAAGIGITSKGRGFNLENYGEVHAEFVGVLLSRFGTHDTEADILNEGTISARHGILSKASLNLVNSGVISGGNGSVPGIGVWVESTDNTQASRIVNTGLIRGDVSAIEFGNSANALDAHDNVVINTGLLQGDVSFSVGNDTYDGRGGRILGVVRGGDGNDSYYVDSMETELEELAGGGVDWVYSEVNYKLGLNIENLTLLGDVDTRGLGNGLNNLMVGNMGDNVLRGRSGDDRLVGDEGKDILRGQSGEDFIFGGDGEDRLYGGADIDFLSGGDDNDRLMGGKGSDSLDGGTGKDVLFGGTGADHFLFGDLADSENSPDADIIKDFERGVDVIELGKFSLGMNFIGSSAFSGAGNELRYTVNKAGHAIVRIDGDGDGIADFKLIVQNTGALDATDFLFFGA